MTPENFIKSYELALGTQDWNVIAPLISRDAVVTFSDGSVHLGKEKIQAAFENNFAKIHNESYAMENIVWLRKEDAFAVYIFEFSWSGIMDGETISGSGLGTSVIVRETGEWKLLSEHLGRKSQR